MTLKEIQSELLALSARSVTLAIALEKHMIEVSKTESIPTSVDWKSLEEGDLVRVEFADGSLRVDTIAAIENTDYDGALPLLLDQMNQWVGPKDLTESMGYSTPTCRQYVKLEKIL